LAIGSTGITVVNTFFESKDDLTTDEKRKAFAKDGLKDLKFLYSTTDSEDPKVWVVLSHLHIVLSHVPAFQGPFLWPILPQSVVLSRWPV
jgi:hypothetical protein